MAQTQAQSPPAATNTNKRGSTRITRAAQPPLKKVKASETPLPSSSPSVLSSSAQSPAPPPTTTSKLPTRIADCRPLPTLSTPQAPNLPSSTHQSLAASAVLQASLDRSRLRWVHHGVFDRYWTKPESGKHAKPPPPNNPEAKWMKHRGPCRLRVEPHIFECEVYVEEKPKPALQKIPPQSQYGQGAYGGYGQQYRPGQQGPAYGQQRPLPLVQQQTPVRPHPTPTPQQRSQSATPQQPEKKPGPDPVISMLAGRASSDPELKALMKEVATGAASPEQLKVFQGHIDELTKIINEKKKKEEEEAAATEAKKAREQQQDAIQYDGAADQKPAHTPQPSPAYRLPQTAPAWPTPPPAVQPHTPPPPPTAPPVILQFTTPGATEDRFLFPPNTIIESLSPQHLLCSTLITRKGRDSADPTSLNADTEYFQPITFMVEVAYGRESLIELVKKFVKPADEVRKWMEDVMQRCTRAPDAHLALRLPVKGTEGAETEEESLEVESKMTEEMRKRGIEVAGFSGFRINGAGGGSAGSHVKYVKKPGPKKGEGGRPVGVKNGEGGGKKSAGAAKGAATADGAGLQPTTAGPSTAAAAAPPPTSVQPSPALLAATTPAPTPSGDGETGTTSAGAAAVPDAAKTADVAGKAAESEEKQPTQDTKEPKAEAEAEAERPKRATRKSVRISDA